MLSSIFRSRRVAAGVVALVASSLLVVATAPSASAAGDIVVTTTADVVNAADGAVSLREAVNDANADAEASTIVLAAGATYSLNCGPAGQEDNNTNGDLDILTELFPTTIRGNGATIRPNGCADERIISTTGTSSLTIENVALRDGRGSPVGTGPAAGGAIYGGAGLVTVVGSAIFDNAVALTCANTCQAAGGAVYSIGAFEATTSTIARNSVTVSGCATSCFSAGGNVAGVGTVTIDQSVVSDGRVSNQSCVTNCTLFGGGIYTAGVSTQVARSTITANVIAAPTCTGTCQSAGGGIEAVNGAQIQNTIIEANTVEAIPGACVACSATGGGIDVTEADSPTQLVHVTVIRNSAPRAANWFQKVGVDAYVLASVLALGNGSVTDSGCEPNANASSGGWNFRSGNDCFTAAITDLVAGGDPRINPVSVGGGLLGTSVLWDRVPPAGCLTTIDRYGRARPVGAGCEPGAVEGVVASSRFVALAPARIFDSRAAEPGPGPKGFVAAASTVDVQVTGVGGVPASATAVVLNVTATEAAGPGFVTAWPTGQARPLASNLNLTAANQTRPNSVTVPLGAGGRVSLYTQAGTHLVADVAGYYEPVADRQRAGRIVTQVPVRVFDSRPEEAAPGPKGFVPAGTTVDVQISGVGGVPSAGVAAVVANITATGSDGPGFVTAWPTGDIRPLASALNLNAAGETAPNLVIVPLGANGRISLFTQAGAHLIVDVTGYVTDASAAPDTLGLFRPLSPGRVFDTRPEEAPPGPKGRIGPNGVITVQYAGVVGIPTQSVSAVVTNVTATDTGDPGFVTVWPTGQNRPVASTVNHTSADTRPNSAILALGTGGRLDLFSQSATNLLADTSGYFTS